MSDELKDAINSAIESRDSAIKFILKYVIGGSLYSVIQEMEKEGIVGGIDDLIDIIFKTACYRGPDNEEYPSWILNERFLGDDKTREKANKILKTLKKVLARHGIQGIF